MKSRAELLMEIEAPGRGLLRMERLFSTFGHKISQHHLFFNTFSFVKVHLSIRLTKFHIGLKSLECVEIFIQYSHLR